MKPRIPRDWVGETVFILAGGPSVTPADIERLKGQRVLVVNSSYYSVRGADTLLFTDLRWWRKHQRRVRSIFSGEVVTLTPDNEAYQGIKIYDRQRSGGISTDPTRLAWWHTSVTTALNYVALKGATTIALLGLDGQDAPDGRTWHHAPHPEKWGRNPKCYEMHGIALAAMVEPLREIGVRVLNLNANSAHRMFEFGSMDELLPERAAA